MNLFGKSRAKSAQTAPSPASAEQASPKKSRGLRMTETFLPVFGPAQVGDSKQPIRPANAEEQQRENDLNSAFVHKTSPDGKVYLVERSAE
ncbi:hypothetical protein [Timonella senegalensis]|uniref:hypothetical protein n=1 Tax=Timonella senegalensis TaxID=1465825 RepID=UPI0028A92FE4|nr:hypothetical protein [Timonella senegalensis]